MIYCGRYARHGLALGDRDELYRTGLTPGPSRSIDKPLSYSMNIPNNISQAGTPAL